MKTFSFKSIIQLVFLVVFINNCLIHAQTQIQAYQFLGGSVDVIKKDPVGNMYVGGKFTQIGQYTSSGVKMNTTNSTYNLDDVKFNSTVKVVIPIPGGGWYVGGDFTKVGNQNRNRIARINADGSLHDFNPDISSSVNAIELDASGNVYIGGAFSTVNGVYRSKIAKLSPDGNLLSFHTPVVGTSVKALALDGSGNLFIGGSFTSVNGTARTGFAKINPDGTLNSINISNAIVNAFALDQSDNLYIGGSSFFRVNADGTRDLTFIPANNGSITSLYIDDDGSIYAGGNFTTMLGSTRNHLAKLNPDHTLNAFAPSVNNIVYAITMDNLNQVYIGGDFQTVNGQARLFMAKINSDGSLNAFAPRFDLPILTLASQGDETEIFIGGSQTYMNPINRSKLAKINADGTLNPFDAKIVGNWVSDIAIDQSLNVYIGGFFSKVDSTIFRKNFAKFNANGTVNAFNPVFDQYVNTIHIDPSGKLLIGGFFTSIIYLGSTINRPYFVRFNANGSLNSLDLNMTGFVNDIETDQSSNIYLGGNFNSVLGSSRNYFAKINSNGTLSTINPSPNATILEVELDSANNIYLGGGFSTIGGVSKKCLAKIRPNGTLDPFDAGLNGGIEAIVFDQYWNLYIGGYFTFLKDSTAARNRLAKFDPYGNLQNFNPFNPVKVMCLEVDNRDRLHVGHFTAGSYSTFYAIFETCSTPVTQLNSDQLICGSGNVHLSASTSGGSIYWYDQAIGGNLLGIGDNYTTPNITGTTNFYYQAIDGSCYSARSLTSVSPGNCTKMIDALCGTQVSDMTNTLTCNPVSGATAYRFKLITSDTNFIYTSNTNSFKFSQITSLTYNTTYSIVVAAQVGGVWSDYGSACSISTPLTKIQPWYCGANFTAFDQYLAAYSVPNALYYRFQLFDGTTTLYYSSSTPALRLINVPQARSDKNYTISVSSFVNGIWSAYGESCELFAPLPKIQNWYCGITVNPMSQYLACYAITGAVKYKFKLFDGTNTLYYTSNGVGLRMSYVPGIQTNTTYAISVSYSTDGVTWSDYGYACNITSAATMSAQHDDHEIITDLGGQLQEDFTIDAFPNPNSGSFTVVSNYTGEFYLTNELGQVLQTINLNADNKQHVELELLDHGVYFITGMINGQFVSKKVLVML